MTKRRTLMTVMLSVLLCCIFLLVGCGDKGSNVPVKFGEFGYKGRYLTPFASQTIQASKAKQILSDNMSSSLLSVSAASISGEVDPSPAQELVDFILSRYSGCQITTKFYVEGSDKQETKSDYLIGTDLKNMLEENKFTPFSQLVAKYVICFPSLIDTMENLNAEFKDSSAALIAPFTNIFTYHTNAKGELVIQTRDFAEIPSSVGGGIASSYRQDTEILYDNQNKIQKWQTSLGLYSATPKGTMKQGYILEVEFNWELKI